MSLPVPRKPLVLLPACNRLRGEHPEHVVGAPYVEALRLAGCRPLIVPNAHPDEIDEWLDLADGVLLTGSASNVHPRHFDQPLHDPSLPLDPQRDAWTLPLIARATRRGIPLFAICRGFQEMNVAFGGSLHQAVHEIPGRDDHRAADESSATLEFGLAHDVVLEAGGRLAAVIGAPRVRVNSVHGQGIDRLAVGLRVEARAPDGLVEALSVIDSAGFSLGVQWHPEWQAADNAVSMRLLGAFGMACEAYRASHH